MTYKWCIKCSSHERHGIAISKFERIHSTAIIIVTYEEIRHRHGISEPSGRLGIEKG